jgi:hypothetical protein
MFSFVPLEAAKSIAGFFKPKPDSSLATSQMTSPQRPVMISSVSTPPTLTSLIATPIATPLTTRKRNNNHLLTEAASQQSIPTNNTHYISATTTMSQPHDSKREHLTLEDDVVELLLPLASILIPSPTSTTSSTPTTTSQLSSQVVTSFVCTKCQQAIPEIGEPTSHSSPFVGELMITCYRTSRA